jgi:glycosyltransferase involved in cell wall biosynthesis
VRVGFDARMVDWSGIGRYSRNLLSALAEESPENTYVLFANRQNQRWLPGGAAFEPIFVDLEVFRLGSVLGMSTAIKRAKLDIFHSPHFASPFSKYCPVVNTIHDLIPLTFTKAMPGYFRRLRYRWLNKFALSRADALITVSGFTKGQILNSFRLDHERIFVVPLAADEGLEKYAGDGDQAGVRARFSITNNYLLAFGNTKAHKNTAQLIKAFAMAKKKALTDGRRPQLVLVGSESAGLKLKPLAAHLGLIDQDLVFLPFVSDRELAALYQGALAFIMPSVIEGFGLPALEAMACGAPVVCSNQGSLPEVVGHAAAMFDPHDVGEMEKVISRVVQSQSEREDLARRGLERAKTFSWRKTAKATLEVYRRVLAS